MLKAFGKGSLALILVRHALCCSLLTTTDYEYLSVTRGQLTFASEGNNEVGDNYCSRKLHYWPERNDKGVTIGRGFDLSKLTNLEAELHMDAAGIKGKQKQILLNAVGKEGSEAETYVKQNRKEFGTLKLNKQKNLFESVITDIEGQVMSIYANFIEEFADLCPSILDLLIDLVFRGDHKKKKKKIAKMANKNKTKKLIKIIGKKSKWVNKWGVTEDRFQARLNLMIGADYLCKPLSVALISGNWKDVNEIIYSDDAHTPFVLSGGVMDTTSLAVADMNGDGLLDLVLGNYADKNQILFNDGSDSFNAELRGDISNTWSVQVADINGSGLLDILVGNWNEENEIIYNDGTSINLPGAAGRTRAIVSADMDVDGDVDIVVGEWGNNVQILDNDSSGSFTATALPDVEDYLTSMALADLNKDGFNDIVVVNRSNNDSKVFLSDGTGSYTPISLGSLEVEDVTVADINGDGDYDLVLGTQFSYPNILLLNNGNGQSFTQLNLPGGTSFTTHGLAVADVNGDGYQDIFLGNYGYHNQILFNKGDTTFIPVNLPGEYKQTQAVTILPPKNKN